MATTYEIHPLAEIFPLMTDEELNELGDDIKKFGQREPIKLFDGKILDGRNRYEACLRKGIEPVTVEYQGDDAVAFVVSENLRRRHLNESQRAMVATRLTNLSHGGDPNDIMADLMIRTTSWPTTRNASRYPAT